jgi:hypothetical protein
VCGIQFFDAAFIKSPLLDHILSQINPVSILLTSYLCKMCLNIILPTMHRIFKWSLPIKFTDWHFVWFSAPCILHVPTISSSQFYHPNHLWWRVHIVKLFFMQCFHPHVSSCLLDPHILIYSFVLPLGWDTKLYAPTKQRVKLQVYAFHIY